MVKALNMEKVNSLRYPPITEKKIGWLDFLALNEPKKPSKFFSFF